MFIWLLTIIKVWRIFFVSSVAKIKSNDRLQMTLLTKAYKKKQKTEYYLQIADLITFNNKISGIAKYNKNIQWHWKNQNNYLLRINNFSQQLPLKYLKSSMFIPNLYAFQMIPELI